jgi:tetratricopeptide (TPR) repeat protein
MTNSRLMQLLEYLDEDPNDSFTIYAIAMEYSKTDEKKALEYYNKLLNANANYVATYYHAGKLHEKMGNKKEAEGIYKKGMEISKNLKNIHAFSELQSAYNQLLELEDED